VCKIFAWWLLFFGSNITEVEATLSNSFQPLHQFSYLTLTTFLAVGLLVKSKFALYSFLVTFALNLFIFIVKGTVVYQSVLDPVLIACLGLVVFCRRPNWWFKVVES